MNTPTIADALNSLRRCGAPREALTWLAAQPDLETAWAACEQPQWLLWLARRSGVGKTALVRIACGCARTSLRFVPGSDPLPLRAAEAWCGGRSSREEAQAAYDADYAHDAAGSDPADYAHDAARSAAYAAAADDFNEVVIGAADAAAYAAGAYAAAGGAAARREANVQMCGIVRQHISLAQIIGGRR